MLDLADMGNERVRRRGYRVPHFLRRETPIGSVQDRIVPVGVRRATTDERAFVRPVNDDVLTRGVGRFGGTLGAARYCENGDCENACEGLHVAPSGPARANSISRTVRTKSASFFFCAVGSSAYGRKHGCVFFSGSLTSPYTHPAAAFSVSQRS